MNARIDVKCFGCGRWGTTVFKDGVSFCQHCGKPVVYIEGKDGIVILKKDSVSQ